MTIGPALGAGGGFRADGPTLDLWSPEEAAAVLDDRTVAYVAKAREAFAAVRQSAAQLAGVLILAAAQQRRGADPAHPMLALAREALDEATEVAFGLVPPPRARHHHLHLTRAIAAVRSTVREAERTRTLGEAGQFDRALGGLKAAWLDVEACSRSLPGFEIVDFNQSCCAMHRLR